jgi:hypothetical protein
VQRRVAELLDLLDPGHELRELLELRPLVVDALERGLDLDRLLDLAGRAPSSGRL